MASSRPVEIARAEKLQPRPKSVGWNPFGASKSTKRRRSRTGSSSTSRVVVPPPTTRTNVSIEGAATTTMNDMQSASLMSATNNSAVQLGNTSVSGISAVDTNNHGNHGGGGHGKTMVASQSAPHFAAAQLSHLPDGQVWESLSTMSLRDLAAGHHCMPLPPKVVHPLLAKHSRDVKREQSYDKHCRMMNNLEKREQARWRLASRKKERVAIQEYCSQPVLHIPDPNVDLNISEPMTVGQVLRSKYEKTHPPPSYNVKVYNDLKKKADLRALQMILHRFDRSEKHEDHVATVKDYTRSMSRGSLRVAAMKRSELETRLGTPFALSGTSIYAKPSTSPAGKRRRRRGGSRSGGSRSEGLARAQTTSGGSRTFGRGAFDIPSGVAKPGEMLSMPSLSMPALSPETEMRGGGDGSGGGSGGGGGGGSSGHSAFEEGGSVPFAKPIWQRDPHEHWKPPSHYLRTLEKSAISKKKKRMRGGFPNKYIYPSEIQGLDTLFPE